MKRRRRKGETVAKCPKCSAATFTIIQTTNLLTGEAIYLVSCGECAEQWRPEAK